MDYSTSFKGFIKVCDSLTKIYKHDVILSNGVFMWLNERSLSVITFSEKLETDILHLLDMRISFKPSLFKFMDKYFDIHSIHMDDTKIEFKFTGDLSDKVIDTKEITDILPLLTKDIDGVLTVTIPYLHDSDPIYTDIVWMLNKVDKDVDFDKSVIISDLDKEFIMKGIRPVVIDQDGYYVRLAKSVFQSVNAKDEISLRCSPYKNNDSIFLCTATVKKDQCCLINVFNVLRI